MIFLSPNTSKDPQARILFISEMSLKAIIVYSFMLIYLWLCHLLPEWLSFLTVLSLSLLPASHIPKFTLHHPFSLKYLSGNIACLLKKKRRNPKENTCVSVWQQSNAPCTSPTMALHELSAPATGSPTLPDAAPLCALLAFFLCRAGPPYSLNKVQLTCHLFRGTILIVLSCPIPYSTQNKRRLPLHLHRKC